jgi:hypothetical protein
VTNNGIVSGNISAAGFAGTGTQSNGSHVAAPTMAPAPSSTVNVTNYAQNYQYQGVLYAPTLISATVAANTSYGPTPTNPLGVYYTSASLSISTAKTLTINGTLLVQGTLTNSGSVSITPINPTSSTNMPALVIDNKLTINGAGRSVVANGVTYVGQGITGSGATGTSSIQVNGALLVTGGGITAYTGALAVTYNSASTNIPSFDTADWNSGSGVKIISWSE